MFKIKEIVETSGRGRTAEWRETLAGTVTEAFENVVRVQWHNSAVEDEMKFDELISTGEFADSVPNNFRTLRADENGLTEAELLTIRNK